MKEKYRKIELFRVYGSEMKENVPLLLISYLPKADEHCEKLVFEIKQKKKSDNSFVNGRWFKISFGHEFENLVQVILNLYASFVSLNYDIDVARNRMESLVRKSLKYASLYGKNYLKERMRELPVQEKIDVFGDAR